MVAPGNVKGANVQAPPPHGQYRQPSAVKAAGAVAPSLGMPFTPTMGNQTSPKLPAATQNTEVLNQTRKLPFCPIRMGIVGFGAALGVFYFTLYAHKKPEATAVDVARVATGTATPGNTHPRN